MTQRDDSDIPISDFAQAIGVGAANLMEVLDEELLRLVNEVTTASANARQGLIRAGIHPRTVAGMVLGAAVEAVL